MCERENICVHACDPLSDLEKQLDQSENLWQLGNTLQGKNNLHQLHGNYKAAKQKHVYNNKKPRCVSLRPAFSTSAVLCGPAQQVGLQ